jgi:segregation and condensation protein A
VAFVTEKYLEYLGLMQQMNLDIAAEYLVMAATLAYIKSKMLLPPDPSQQEEEAAAEEEIDPRAELIRRLLEYQKYKQAAEALASRGVAGRDVFFRGMEAPEALGEAPLAGFGLFKLLDAFAAVVERTKSKSSFAVTSEGIGIADRMRQLVDKLAEKKNCRFEELFDDVASVYDLVVTFLAILELAKRRLARVYQTEPIAPIYLEYRVLDADATNDALSSAVTADGEAPGEEPAPVPAKAADPDQDESIARAGEDPLGEAYEGALEGGNVLDAEEDLPVARAKDEDE